ncbi:MAG TPA: hypothetical protein VG273_11960 [Bryobacteraceae bacterium]|jgi:hypothetical protein|nr:hypothetical protein [Bryobacteraceae bacterium]
MICAELEIRTGGICATPVGPEIRVASAAGRILRAVGADKERLNGVLAAEAVTILDEAIIYIERNHQRLAMLDLDNGDLVPAVQQFLRDLRQDCVDHPKASVNVWI